MTDTQTAAMRAMDCADGSPRMMELSRPEPGAGQVRVKVVAAAVNAAEEKVVSGDFVGRFLHAKRRPLVVGWDFSGTVDAVGGGVTNVAVGDAVWGHLAFTPSQKQGTYAEYVIAHVDEIASKPDNVSHQIAAAAATCAMTSLQALRDDGRLKSGGTVLVIGGGGGVGELAIGIAKRLGAHVSAVCSTKDVERVTQMGADVVIDRKEADPFDAVGAYDVVFDTPAVHSYGSCAGLLRAGGAYVTTLPDLGLMTGTVASLFSSKRCRFIQVASKRADLELVGGWLADGLQVTIDSTHPVARLSDALARQVDRRRSGRVVVDVSGGWSVG